MANSNIKCVVLVVTRLLNIQVKKVFFPPHCLSITMNKGCHVSLCKLLDFHNTIVDSRGSNTETYKNVCLFLGKQSDDLGVVSGHSLVTPGQDKRAGILMFGQQSWAVSPPRKRSS